MYLTYWYLKALWLYFIQNLQNGVQTVDVVSSKEVLSNSTAASRVLTDVAVGLDALAFVENGIA